MQTREKLRTGSMMTFDAEKAINIQNRDPDPDPDEIWCMAIANKGMRPGPDFHLRANDVKVKLLTFYKLTKAQHAALYVDSSSRRCTLVTLPPGVTPRDLEIQGR